jgi:hypothetical protein
MQAGDETVDDETAETKEAVKAALDEAWFMAKLMCPNLSDKFWKMCKDAVAPMKEFKQKASTLEASYLDRLITMLPFMNPPERDVLRYFYTQHAIYMEEAKPPTDRTVRLTKFFQELDRLNLLE